VRDEDAELRVADEQIFEEQRIAQGETETRISLIGSTRKAGSGMNPDRDVEFFGNREIRLERRIARR
jgi:hypothetical protein